MTREPNFVISSGRKAKRNFKRVPEPFFLKNEPEKNFYEQQEKNLSIKKKREK